MLTRIEYPINRPAPVLSVVVVAWRRDEDLPSCLEAICNQTLDRQQYEIIVVDNGGNPSARRRCAHMVDLWYESPTNCGCSGGRNVGARLARGTFIAFIDDDGEIERPFLATALSTIQSSDDIAGVRGKVVYRKHRYMTMLAGVYDLGTAQLPRVTLDCEGASIVRSAMYCAIDGFDERLAGGEGLDWTVRVMLAFPGAHVVYEPGMVMHHDYVDSPVRYVSKVHMNRRSRERQSAQLDEFPTLRVPPELGIQKDLPDRRPLLDRIVCKLGRYAVRATEWIPERDDYRRK